MPDGKARGKESGLESLSGERRQATRAGKGDDSVDGAVGMRHFRVTLRHRVRILPNGAGDKVRKATFFLSGIWH